MFWAVGIVQSIITFCDVCYLRKIVGLKNNALRSSRAEAVVKSDVL